MKQLLLSLLLALPTFVFAQSYSVESTDNKSKQIIETALKDLKQDVSMAESDIVLELIVRQTSKVNSMYKGCIIARDRKTAQELSRTKEIRRGAVAVNGYNASANIAQVISKKLLPSFLLELKK